MTFFTLLFLCLLCGFGCAGSMPRGAIVNIDDVREADYVKLHLPEFISLKPVNLSISAQGNSTRVSVYGVEDSRKQNEVKKGLKRFREAMKNEGRFSKPILLVFEAAEKHQGDK